jgi:hypothetical protein
MLDQFLSRIFSSWIVFAILAVVPLALSEFGWRVGLARSRVKPEKTKDGGSVITLDDRPLLELNDSPK